MLTMLFFVCEHNSPPTSNLVQYVVSGDNVIHSLAGCSSGCELARFLCGSTGLVGGFQLVHAMILIAAKPYVLVVTKPVETVVVDLSRAVKRGARW